MKIYRKKEIHFYFVTKEICINKYLFKKNRNSLMYQFVMLKHLTASKE